MHVAVLCVVVCVYMNWECMHVTVLCVVVCVYMNWEC